jgi:hypothetical protein
MSALTAAEPSPQLQTPLLEIRARQCRFIVSADVRDAVCCGATTPENSSWCTYHRQLVYLPDRDRRKAA